MKQLYPLSGIVTVLNTPFTSTGNVDYLALKLNVEEALIAGVAGFLVPAMASEVQKLTLQEKLNMVVTVLNAVNGKVPVFAGTSSSSVKESRKTISLYQNEGCDHFLVQLPFRSEEKFKGDFYSLADLDPEVIMLQDWDATGYGLPDELIMELFDDVPAFRCLKVETMPAGVKYSRMIELSHGTLHVSGGWAVSQMPEALMRGIHAFMPTGMHWIYTRIFNLFQQGEHKSAIELFNEILPVLAFSNQSLDISIHFFKWLLWKQQIYRTPNVRSPIVPFDQFHQEIANQLIEKVIRIENRLKKIIINQA